MIKLVAFDLDGTLADTLADLAHSMNHALSAVGLPTHPVDSYRYFVGNGIDNLVKVTMGGAYTPEGAAAVKEGFQKYYADHYLDYTARYDGIAGLLDRLAADGIMTAVASNKPDMFVPGILEALYPDHRFTVAWGQREGIPRKPSPEALLLLLDEVGVKSSETLYVGDSNVDVAFAHNAGVRVCGVNWGFRGAEELREAGADHIVYSAKELYELVNSLSSSEG